MPVLQTEDEIIPRAIPRSVIRHRPIKDSTPPGARRTTTTAANNPTVQRASRARPAASDTLDDIAEWRQERPRVDTRPPVHERDTRRPTTRTSSRPPAKKTARGELATQIHPLVYLGVGMLVMFMLWTLLTAVFGWVNTAMDDLRYGRPRTYQTDVWVGHEQTGVRSHFIAINLHRHIEIIELPGGDAAHAHIYVGPQLYGSGDELTPVTLTFLDVNGDHKPDMLVNFQGSRTVFINDQGTFRPAQPDERQQIEKFLQQHAP